MRDLFACPETHHATCPLCPKYDSCGLTVEVEGGKLVSVRGDVDDPLSQGYLLSEGRSASSTSITTPTAWPARSAAQVSAADRSRLGRGHRQRSAPKWQIQRDHGKDAMAFYYGNPTAHAYASVLYGVLFRTQLGSKNAYSSNSVDALPRLFVSLLVYGSQAILPVPDLDRTRFLLVLGANPAVSNGSVMTAPDVKKRLERIRARGGRVVVVDPRRTETALLADEHFFIRPGTDGLLLAAMIKTIFDERLDKLGRLAPFVEGLAEVRAAVAPFTPARRSRPTSASTPTTSPSSRATSPRPRAPLATAASAPASRTSARRRRGSSTCSTSSPATSTARAG